jgi:protein N-terminal methyltransferase
LGVELLKSREVGIWGTSISWARTLDTDIGARIMADGAPDSLINHEKAKDYWSSFEPTVDTMVMGYAHISKTDLQGSKNFLAKLGIAGRQRSDRPLREQSTKEEKVEKIKRAVDCGAGIGRITEGLLLSVAETVDIIEPVKKFTDTLKDKQGVGRIWNVGMEEWEFDGHDDSKYDLIWNQWCLGHLTDSQLVEYLKRCAKALKPGGWIAVKENIGTGSSDVFDDVDNSVTRSVYPVSTACRS